MVKCSASQPVVLRRQEGRRQEPGEGESGGQPSFGVTGASGARTDLGILWYCTLKKSQVRIACIPWGDGGRQGRSRRAPTQVVKEGSLLSTWPTGRRRKEGHSSLSSWASLAVFGHMSTSWESIYREHMSTSCRCLDAKHSSAMDTWNHKHTRTQQRENQTVQHY